MRARRLHRSLGQHEDAIQHARRACELEPNDPFSFTALSVTYQRAFAGTNNMQYIRMAEDAMEQSRMLQFQLQGNKPMREITSAMYLGILSRFPTEAELKAAEAYAKSATNRREAVIDLAWALITSTEFLYRH